MKRMTYVGPIKDLLGEKALVKVEVGTPDGKVEAMFDEDLEDPRRPDAPPVAGPRGKLLAYGWHRFDRGDFA